MIADFGEHNTEFEEELTWQIQLRSQQLEREKQQMKRERDQAIQEKIEKERELGRVNQQLEESERLIADFGKRNTELEEEVRVLRSQVQGKDGGAKAGAVSRTNFKLRWREGEKAPRVMSRLCDAVVHNDTVYCSYCDSNYKVHVYAYHISSSSWSLTPDTPYGGFTLTVIDGLLTTVGGYGDNGNKLLSLTGEGSGRRWTEKFPPMPTKRYGVSALCTGTTLIVAGGDDGKNNVEVLNTDTREWHTAPDLPLPLARSSIALCGDLVYLLGGLNKNREFINSVYSCSLTSVLSSTGSKTLGGRLVSTLTRSSPGSPWNRVTDLPLVGSTAVSLHGRLLAIGGQDSKWKPTTAVYMHHPTTNSWGIISHMTTPRSQCLSAVLPDNQLMVVGGLTTDHKECDLVEFGTVL